MSRFRKRIISADLPILKKLTVVDLFFLPFGDLLKVAGSDALESDARPNVKRWFEEIRSRESWQANQETAQAYTGDV